MCKKKIIFGKDKKARRRGAEAIESILMIGIVISLVIAVFYPQFTNIINTTMAELNEWFTNALNSLIS